MDGFVDFELFDDFNSQPVQLINDALILNEKLPVTNNNLSPMCSIPYDGKSLAKRIANVNDLVLQIKSLTNANENLKKQLLELSTSSNTVQQMYSEEKRHTEQLTKSCEQYEEELKQIKNDLANKSLKFEQILHLQSKESNKPVEYNELCIKYLKLFKMLETNSYKPRYDILFKNKICSYISLVDDNFIKKSIKNCKLLESNKHSENNEKAKETLSKGKKPALDSIENIKISSNNEDTICGNILSKKSTVSQGTQYISTTTTRGTCTSAFIKKHNVGTNFPEILPISIEGILKEMILDIRPVSPLKEEIEEIPPLITSESKSTNTDLRNVRMHIDYVYSPSLISIKKSDSRPPSRVMYDNIKSEQASCLENGFNHLGYEINSINDLWNLLGQTIFALIRNGNTQINQTQIDLLNERMEILNEQLHKEEKEREIRCFINNDPKYDYYNDNISNENYLENFFSNKDIVNEYDTTIRNCHQSGKNMKEPESSTKLAASDLLQNYSPKHILNNIFSNIISNQLISKVDLQNKPLNTVIEDNLPESNINTSYSKSLKSTGNQNTSATSEESDPNFNTTIQNSIHTTTLNCRKDAYERDVAENQHNAFNGENTKKANIDEYFCNQTNSDSYQLYEQADLPKTQQNSLNGEISEKVNNDEDSCHHYVQEDDNKNQYIERVNIFKDFYGQKDLNSYQVYEQDNVAKKQHNTFNVEIVDKVNNVEQLDLLKSGVEKPQEDLLSNHVISLPIANANEAKDQISSVKCRETSDLKEKKENVVQPANMVVFEEIQESEKDVDTQSTNMIIKEIKKIDNEVNCQKIFNIIENIETISRKNTPANINKEVETLTTRNPINYTLDGLQDLETIQVSDSTLARSINLNTNTPLISLPSETVKVNEFNHIDAVDSNKLQPKPLDYQDNANLIKEIIKTSPNIKSIELNLLNKHNNEIKTDDTNDLKRVIISKEYSENSKIIDTVDRSLDKYKPNQISNDQKETTYKIVNGNITQGCVDNSINAVDLILKLFKNSINKSVKNKIKHKRVLRLPIHKKHILKQKKDSSVNKSNNMHLRKRIKRKTDHVIPTEPKNAFSNHNVQTCDEESHLIGNNKKNADKEDSTPIQVCSWDNISSGNKNSSFEHKIIDSQEPLDNTNLLPQCSLLINTSQEDKLFDLLDESKEIQCLQSNCNLVNTAQILENDVEDIFESLSDISCSPPSEKLLPKKIEWNLDTNPTDLSCINNKAVLCSKNNFSSTLQSCSSYSILHQDSGQALDDDYLFLKDNDKERNPLLSIEDGNLEIENLNKRKRKIKEFFGSSDEEDLENLRHCKVANQANSTELKVQSEIRFPSGFDKEYLVSESETDSMDSSFGELKIITDLEVESNETEIISIDEETLLAQKNNVFIEYSSPSSPNPEDNETYVNETKIIPLNRNKTTLRFNSIINRLINNYDSKNRANVCQRRTGLKKEQSIITKCRGFIENFLHSVASNVELTECVNYIISLTQKPKLIALAIIENAKFVSELAVIDCQLIPWMTKTHHKIIVLIHSLQLHFDQLGAITIKLVEESLFGFKADSIPLEVLINLTQLYVSIIDTTTDIRNPARLFIFKCLYFHKVKAIPMIYQILLAYPSVLPIKGDPYYDRSDSLINTIHCILTNTIYNLDETDLKHRQFINLIRYRYKYENFKPMKTEIIENLLLKIRAGKFKNVSYSFALLCKRQDQNWIEKFTLNPLKTLAGVYFNQVNLTDANDLSIACTLECISFIIKPLPLETDISQYLSIYDKFLSAGTGRSIIEEAAVCSIIRTARFGYVNAFNLICHFNPKYNLQSKTKAMIKSFVYKKNISYLNLLTQQLNMLDNT